MTPAPMLTSGADVGVAEVGEVEGLGALAPSRAFLISTKLPTRTSSSSSQPGRRREYGPTRARGPTFAPSASQCGPIAASGGQLGVDEPREREDLAALRERRAPLEGDERVQDHVRRDDDARPDAHGRRIEDRHARVERPFDAAPPLDLLGGGEVSPRVDAPGLAPVLGLDGLDPFPRRAARIATASVR